MAERREYEPGRGVCPVEWREGDPEQHGLVIAELWNVELHFSDLQCVDVKARILVLEWKELNGKCQWVRVESQRPLPEDWRFRRFFRCGFTSTNITITQRDWNV